MRKLRLKINNLPKMTQLGIGRLGVRIQTNYFRVCISINGMLALPHPNHTTTQMLYVRLS